MGSAKWNNLIILFKVTSISLAGLGVAHGSHISACSRETAGIIDIWHEAASETNLQASAIFSQFFLVGKRTLT